MSGLSVVTGVIAYAAPKTNLAGYGVAEADVTKDAKGFMRLLAAGQIVNGATLIAAETDLDKAVATSLTGSAVMLLTAIPATFELMDAPTGPILLWVAVLTTVGKMAREGKIGKDAALKFAALFQIVTSVQEILLPALTWDTYKSARSPRHEPLCPAFCHRACQSSHL